MPRFQAEPPHQHGSAPGTAVVVVNLGTPEAPTAPALKRYLRQFLSDPRVVEFPRALWWLILNGIILNIRPKKSAAKYASVWMAEGSPLKVHTERQTQFLAGHLGERGHHLTVTSAMRYGAPSVPAVLDRLKAAGVTKITVSRYLREPVVPVEPRRDLRFGPLGRHHPALHRDRKSVV